MTIHCNTKFLKMFVQSNNQNNYREMFENEPTSDKFIHSDNLITSFGSASNIVIQGVKENELPQFTTMWTAVGFPNTCITVPLG